MFNKKLAKTMDDKKQALKLLLEFYKATKSVKFILHADRYLECHGSCHSSFLL